MQKIHFFWPNSLLKKLYFICITVIVQKLQSSLFSTISRLTPAFFKASVRTLRVPVEEIADACRSILPFCEPLEAHSKDCVFLTLAFVVYTKEIFFSLLYLHRLKVLKKSTYILHRSTSFLFHLKINQLQKCKFNKFKISVETVKPFGYTKQFCTLYWSRLYLTV